MVAKGDALGKLDSAPLTLAVTQAKAALTQAKAALTAARAQRVLVDDKYSVDLEKKAAREAVDAATQGVTAAERVLKQAEGNLSRVTLTAPIAGMVSLPSGTEAGMGVKGLTWSAAALGALLNEGIGDTIRVSLTPRPGGDRREEVYAACEILQAMGLRTFAPSVTACPGCGRTTSSTFQELAERVQDYIREQMPSWKTKYDGVETLTLAVMGCVVNGPGESKAANIGISLPGTGEAPNCPVFILSLIHI